MRWLFKISWLQIYRLIAPIRIQFVLGAFKEYIAQTKKHLWASSLCHSLVLHTYGQH